LYKSSTLFALSSVFPRELVITGLVFALADFVFEASFPIDETEKNYQ